MSRGDRGMGEWAPDVREGMKTTQDIKGLEKSVNKGAVPTTNSPLGPGAEGLDHIKDVGDNISGG